MRLFTTAPARVLVGVLLAFAISLASPARATAEPGKMKMVEIQASLPPTPVKVDGKLRLVYELQLDNLTNDVVELTRVSVLNADQKRSVLGDFRGAQLGSLFDPMGIRPVEPAGRVVLYFWLTLDNAIAPRQVTHAIEFDVIRDDGRKHALAEGGELTVGNTPPVVLDPPLRGGPWAAVYDPSMARGHRRVRLTIQQRTRIPGRYAIDWFKVDQDGKPARHDDSKVTNWYGYGADVLAVADSIVADARDSIPESPTLSNGPANTLENGSGNYIALDLGHGRYAFYEHLKPGSVAVKAGDRVRRGQVIAALGYTGDSSGPHLHFHVSDANSPLAAEGLPYVFRSFGVRGAFESIEAFAEGKRWLPLPNESPTVRASELPAANSVVEFRALEQDADSGQ